jgi:hypothetical protein
MKQREAYRDVPISKTEFTCYLTHLENLQPRNCPHFVLLKLVPEHHSDIVEHHHQTKTKFKNRDNTEQEFEEA